ncbi:MAG: enoyl-CoA hydratase/isomerase family protein [Rhodocyclales bacterium]|nr:enoyl-CoA hydratase/isomerase family protein [Rhodocyclales bacterium]
MNFEAGIGWEIADGIGRIVLSRPERANTLALPVAYALAKAIDAAVASVPRVLLLSARGSIFCGGGDIDELREAGPALGALLDRILGVAHPAIQRLANAPFPVVAAVEGAIGGAGVGLALSADFVLASDAMKLRTGYAAIGLSPDLGSSYFLARRIGPVRAKQWLMLSETIDAQTCLSAGVIDALYPDAELAAAAEALVHRLAAAAPNSLAAIRTLCDGLPERLLGQHLACEHTLLRRCADSANGLEGVRAFIERRAPNFIDSSHDASESRLR